MNIRPRRNRSSKNLRELSREVYLEPSDLIYPVFVVEGSKIRSEIKSMPGQYRLSLDLLLEDLAPLVESGLNALAVFPAISDAKKDKKGSNALEPDGLGCKSLKLIKNAFPDLTLIADVALDPYSSDGHDGIVSESGEILNDESVDILAEMALAFARSGADILAPSDMMDGRVGAIRNILDENGLTGKSILSYCAKYASSFYGPFRDALDSAPKFGDKKTYQMDYRNKREALRELYLDEEEGADILMVKPASFYLDIIQDFRENSDLPISAYQVSGEYAMIHAAAANGWIDLSQCAKESLYSIKRSGADMIFTYFTDAILRGEIKIS